MLKRRNIPSESPLADRLFHVLITCGKNDAVVKEPAKSPRSCIVFILKVLLKYTVINLCLCVDVRAFAGITYYNVCRELFPKALAATVTLRGSANELTR
jgi:hypothetical protein